MNNRLLCGLALAGFVLTGAGCFLRPTQTVSRPSVAPAVRTSIKAYDMIAVTSPFEGDVVSSPLTITGEARGTWYFEASFPVEIYDANGVLLGQYHAEAQADWMTEDWVPFVAVLAFDAPTTETGTLVLRNDNPSGLPEYDKKLEIEVRFEE